jgi:hypothetical protein
LIVFSLLSFAVGALGFVSMRSDIQIIIGLVGLFSGAALLGLAALVGRADQTWRLLKQWEQERDAG